MREQLAGSDAHYAPSPNKQGHFYCSLQGILRDRVAELGARYTASKACTYADQDLFYSYRRDGVTGRMVSMLWIE